MSDMKKLLEYIGENISTNYRQVPYGNATVIHCQPVAFAVPLDYERLEKVAEECGYEIISIVFTPFSSWPMRVYLRAVRDATD